MDYKTIIVDGEEYFLVPKPKKENLSDKYQIRFKKTYVEKHYDVEVFGWSKKTKNGITQDCWVTFRRTEQENGDFQWWDWSTGGVYAHKDMVLLLEQWYSQVEGVKK